MAGSLFRRELNCLRRVRLLPCGLGDFARRSRGRYGRQYALGQVVSYRVHSTLVHLPPFGNSNERAISLASEVLEA